MLSVPSPFSHRTSDDTVWERPRPSVERQHRLSHAFTPAATTSHSPSNPPSDPHRRSRHRQHHHSASAAYPLPQSSTVIKRFSAEKSTSRRFSDGPFPHGRSKLGCTAAGGQPTCPAAFITHKEEGLEQGDGGVGAFPISAQVPIPISASRPGSKPGSRRASSQLHPYLINFTSPIDLLDSTDDGHVHTPTSRSRPPSQPLPIRSTLPSAPSSSGFHAQP